MYNNQYTELYHFGIKGQKWGVRRYQNADGSLTEAGKKKYGKDTGEGLNHYGKDKYYRGERYQRSTGLTKTKSNIKKNAIRAAIGAGAAIGSVELYRHLANRNLKNWGIDATFKPGFGPIKSMLTDVLKGDRDSTILAGVAIGGAIAAGKNGKKAYDNILKKHDIDFYQGYQTYISDGGKKKNYRL